MYTAIFVDDEEWALTGLSEFLDWESLGFTVAGRYTDAVNALEQIGRLRPDALFTDLRMPGMSGIELISRSKAIAPEMECVILSAYRDFDAAVKAMALDVRYYLLKPYEEKDVLAVVRKLAADLEAKKKRAGLRLDAPPQEINRAAEACFQGMPLHPYRAVAIAASGEKPNEAEGCVFAPVSVPGYGNAYLVTAERPQRLNALRQNANLGVSWLYANFAALPAMLEEANRALDGGFAYAENETVRGAQSYICESIDENLTLGGIAARFYLSQTYFSALFKREAGVSVGAFIQRTRLRMAARRLADTGDALIDIACALGYPNYSYFGRLFKREYGVTPEEYRKRARRPRADK